MQQLRGKLLYFVKHFVTHLQQPRSETIESTSIYQASYLPTLLKGALFQPAPVGAHVHQTGAPG